jgi:hypothetical protein
VGAAPLDVGAAAPSSVLLYAAVEEVPVGAVPIEGAASAP